MVYAVCEAYRDAVSSRKENIMSRFFKLIVLFVTPYFAFAFYLSFLGPDRIKKLPTWVFATALCYFMGSIIVAGMMQRQVGKTAVLRVTRDIDTRRVRRVKTLLYSYIFSVVSGIGFAVADIISWSLAIPGIVVAILL